MSKRKLLVRLRQEAGKRRRLEAQASAEESSETPGSRLRGQIVEGLAISAFLSLMLLGSIPMSPSAQSGTGFTYKNKPVSKEYADAIAVMNQASTFAVNRKFADAEILLQKSIDVLGNNAEANSKMGFVLMQQNRAEEALPFYETAMSADSNCEDAYTGLAAVYSTLGRMEDSLRIHKLFLAKFTHSPMYAKFKKQSDYIAAELTARENNHSAARAVGKSSNENYLADSNGARAFSWRRYKKPITVYLQAAANCKNWKPGYNDYMREAFNKWESSSDGQMRFNFVEKAENAQIVCTWTDDSSKMHLLKSGELGETITRATNDGDLVKATITMLTTAPFDSSAVADEMVRLTALHEVGHAIGICGHSSKPSDIMYFAIIAGHKPALSERDYATLKTLYATPEAELRREIAVGSKVDLPPFQHPCTSIGIAGASAGIANGADSLNSLVSNSLKFSMSSNK
jgi:predicted Zn-dependent protease